MNGYLLISGFDIEGLPSAVWPGGETEALTRIERHLERKVSDLHPFTAPPSRQSASPSDFVTFSPLFRPPLPTPSLFQAWVANFERPRMNANSLLASPTGLSPYLRFGCLSCRLFYFKLTDLYRKVSLGRLLASLSLLRYRWCHEERAERMFTRTMAAKANASPVE